MNTPAKPSGTLSYQVILYDRALHPELFKLRGRRVERHACYELETWIMPGSHLLRFEFKTLCATELVTDQDRNLPNAGVVAAFLCAGERDFEHRFDRSKVNYLNTVQTESLSENLYLSTFAELHDFARNAKAIAHEYEDEAGKCLSFVDIQRHAQEIHAQAYHLVANGGLVVRTQSIFEHE